MPEEDDVTFLPPIPGSFAAEMAQVSEAIRRLGEEISRSLGVPFDLAVRSLEIAMRSDMPRERLRFYSPYFTSLVDEIVERERPSAFPSDPYWAPRGPLDPAASQDSSVNSEAYRRIAGGLPPMRHDVRPATGLCACDEPAIARCYTIGCEQMGSLMCARHLTEAHDKHTYPEGVPHG